MRLRVGRPPFCTESFKKVFPSFREWMAEIFHRSVCFSCAAEHFTTSFSEPRKNSSDRLCTEPTPQNVVTNPYRMAGDGDAHKNCADRPQNGLSSEGEDPDIRLQWQNL